MPYIGNITQDFNVNNAMLDTDSVTSIKIVDGTIEGADIAANLDLLRMIFVYERKPRKTNQI